MARKFLPRGAEWLPTLLIGASLLLRVVFWFRRDYNHDDFAFGWGTWAYARGAGGYGYGYVFLLQELLKKLFLWFPESFLSLDIARALVLLANLANLYLVFRIARRLGATKCWALAACAVAAWQPDLILRAEDIRSDPFGTTCLLGGALLLLGAGAAFKPEWIGFLFGLAVILDYKYGVAAPFAAAAVVLLTWPRFVAPLARLLAGALIPVVAYLGRLVVKETWKIFRGGLEETVVSLKIGGEGKAGVHSAAVFHNSPFTFLLIGLGAIGFLLSLLGRRREGFRPAVYAILVVSFFGLFLRLNPFFFPYNFDLFTPLLATLIPGIPIAVERFRGSARTAVLAMGLVCLTAAAEGVPSLAKVLSRTNEAQKRVVRWIWKSTSPDEHVFDWQGMHLFRPGIPHWWLFTGLLPKYASGDWYSIADDLQQSRVTLIISTYRLGWLNAADMDYLKSHYVWIDSCLLAPGHVFSAEDFSAGAVPYEPPVAGDYRMDLAGLPGVRIDGVLAQDHVYLSKKTHTVSVDNPSLVPRFAFVYSTPLRNPADRPCPVNEPLLYGFD